MTKSATADAIFTDDFAAHGASLPGAGVPWLDARRAEAIKTFRAKGVPHRRVEEWKYSDLKSALEAANDVALGTVKWSISAPSLHGVELFDLVGLGGAPAWVEAHLGKATSANAMAAASLALARSGFALRVAKARVVEEPVRVGFSGSGHARALIVLEEGAELTLAEIAAAGEGFRNVGIEIVLGPGARLTHMRIAEAAPSMIEVSDVAVQVARDASYRGHLVNCGASLARINLRLALKEPGANGHLSGVSVLGGDLHADVTTEIVHAAGLTHSTQLFKKVVGGEAHAVYQGKITVAEGANGSDSRQTAKALLLSVAAEADLKPELEIFADDVKCAHGAAVGDLDADSLFYLRARGIPEAEARNLLIHAFVEDALSAIVREDLHEEAVQIVETALRAERVSPQ
jgi:Fe-S cluster assembly protein SufD